MSTSPPILTTKLYMPPARPIPVLRPRLIDGLTRPLTLISAPPGRPSGVGEAALAALQASQPWPPRVILTLLLNDLSALPDTAALILDDYHVITAEVIHEALTFLLDHLPAQLRLVILTRADPPWPLASLRARNHIAEIRASDLMTVIRAPLALSLISSNYVRR